MATIEEFKQYASEIILYSIRNQYKEFGQYTDLPKSFLPEVIYYQLKHRYEAEVPDAIIETALLELSKRNIIKIISDPFSDDFYSFQDQEANIFYESGIKISDSILYKCEHLGDTWISSALRGLVKQYQLGFFIEGELAEAIDGSNLHQDSSWEPLPIDRDTEIYKNVEKKVTELIESVEQDNGYSANEPEERDQIVWSLNNGLELLKNHTPNKEQIITLIKSPIKKLMIRFENHAIGEAAKALFEFIKDNLWGWF